MTRYSKVFGFISDFTGCFEAVSTNITKFSNSVSNFLSDIISYKNLVAIWWLSTSIRQIQNLLPCLTFETKKWQTET
jgi:hypothetical protein